MFPRAFKGIIRRIREGFVAGGLIKGDVEVFEGLRFADIVTRDICARSVLVSPSSAFFSNLPRLLPGLGLKLRGR